MESGTSLETKLEELFELLPLERAMPQLVPRSISPASQEVAGIRAEATIIAGLWLYVDDLERSHTISQNLSSPSGAFWHAIMHRREGDFSNSKYWYRIVGRHPVLDSLEFDPFEFVDQCQANAERDSRDLLDQQRREWKALFDFCLKGAENA